LKGLTKPTKKKNSTAQLRFKTKELLNTILVHYLQTKLFGHISTETEILMMHQLMDPLCKRNSLGCSRNHTTLLFFIL
jgi:hypothetical protein